MHIWTYWEDVSKSYRPWYIDACLQTMKHHCDTGDFEFNIVDKDNYPEFIPDAVSKLYKVHSRYPRLEARFRANYIRGQLLQKYGGIWLDADTIVLNSFQSVFDLLETHEWVGAITPQRRQIITVFIAARPNTDIMNDYVSRFNRLLDKHGNWLQEDSYTIPVMSDIILRRLRKKNHKIHLYRGNEVYPIKYPDRNVFLECRDPYEFIDDDTMCVMLFNNSYHWTWKAKPVSEMINKDILLSKLLRLGLERCNVS